MSVRTEGCPFLTRPGAAFGSERSGSSWQASRPEGIMAAAADIATAGSDVGVIATAEQRSQTSLAKVFPHSLRANGWSQGD